MGFVARYVFSLFFCLSLLSCVPAGEGAGQARLGSACIASEESPAHLTRAAFRPGAISVAAVGDVLMHGLLQRDSHADPRGFAGRLARAAPYLGLADITLANLEGPAARDVGPAGGHSAAGPGLFDNHVYSGYPRFNYHPSLITDLRAAGVDLLQTANNHALDRGPLGVERTIEAIRAAGLPFTGTRPRGGGASWHAVVERGGRRIAFLACSYSNNGNSDPGAQVLPCHRDEAGLLAQIRALASDPAFDAVIFLPHWGVEYQATPSTQQRRLGRAALDAGAAAVIGTHPHVLQPIERYGDGFIAYSLGNFIAAQFEAERRSSAILYFDLVPDGAGGLRAEMPVYLPTRVMRYVGAGVVVVPAERASDGAESVAHVGRVLGGEGLLSLGDLVRLRGREVCVGG